MGERKRPRPAGIDVGLEMDAAAAMIVHLQNTILFIESCEDVSKSLSAPRRVNWPREPDADELEIYNRYQEVVSHLSQNAFLKELQSKGETKWEQRSLARAIKIINRWNTFSLLKRLRASGLM